MGHLDRRRFVASGLAGLAGLAGASSLAAGSAPSPQESSAGSGKGKSMLVLGGTRFLGPEIVKGALARGYEVTLFNRGKSNPKLFPGLEKLKGDRDKKELDALKGRHWDVVVDTSGYVPAHVRDAAKIVAAGGAERYVFISSVSAYADESQADVKEDAPVEPVPAEFVEKTETIRASFAHYGGMKALCEAAAEEVMPGKTLNIRPGYIVGPNDGSDRFTYWPVRVARGGDVLCPGDGKDLQQFVDVRDLGEWTVDLADRGGAGIYNAIGFPGELTTRELIEGCRVVLGSWANLVWIDEEFLGQQLERIWSIPFWKPQAYRGSFNVEKALASGLKLRPVGDTIRDTLAWHQGERGAPALRTGISPEKEAEVIAAWRAR